MPEDKQPADKAIKNARRIVESCRKDEIFMAALMVAGLWDRVCDVAAEADAGGDGTPAPPVPPPGGP